VCIEQERRDSAARIQTKKERNTKLPQKHANISLAWIICAIRDPSSASGKLDLGFNFSSCHRDESQYGKKKNDFRLLKYIKIMPDTNLKIIVCVKPSK